MKNLRKLLTSFALIAVLILAACGGNTNNAEENANNNNNNNNAAQTEEPANTEVILATTTSTEDSGLLDELIPMFEEDTGYHVKTIAVGTGQALAMGEDGEADVLLTHAPASEQELVDSGDVVNYNRVMYNDFIIVGPESDPAGLEGLPIEEAMAKVAETNSEFVSRGDDSGTHKKELALWEAADLDPVDEDWYIESGQGMGDTLQIAAEKEAYVMTDRATYLAQVKNFEHMVILVEGDDDLLNIYHVMEVNSEKHELVNAEGGKAFVEFMISDKAHDVIGTFGEEEYGQPLFFSYLD